VELVARRALIVWAVGTLCLVPVGLGAASGLALGGGVSVGTLVLYRALVRAWARPDRWRRGRLVFAGVWLVKWPAVGALLYFALKDWQVSPLWLCAGIGLVPAVATAVAVWTLIGSERSRRAVVEMK
jgi:hypothetical protein